MTCTASFLQQKKEQWLEALCVLMSFSLSFELPASQSSLECSVGDLYALEGEKMMKWGIVVQKNQRRWMQRSQCSENQPALQHPPSEVILKERSWFLHEAEVTALEWPVVQKILVTLEHLQLNLYLVQISLKDLKSVTHHCCGKNMYEGISENGFLLLLNDLCHISLPKVKKACYFISFYMSVPNIVFVQVWKTESVKPAVSTFSAQLWCAQVL